MDGWMDGRGMFLSKLQRVGNHRAWRQEDGNNDSRWWWGFRKVHSVRRHERERMCRQGILGIEMWAENSAPLAAARWKTNDASAAHTWQRSCEHKKCAQLNFSLWASEFSCMCECRLCSVVVAGREWTCGGIITRQQRVKKRNWIKSLGRSPPCADDYSMTPNYQRYTIFYLFHRYFHLK